MRIACLHFPQFALQCVTHADPSLRGAPIVVVGSSSAAFAGGNRVLHSPIVQACSRAAWGMGARVGMTATAARALNAEVIKVVTADLAAERELVRAIADVLLGSCGGGAVDLGGRIGAGTAHLAMYCEVPAKTRGASFGERLLDKLEGLSVRIGIADDRFTAWVAASSNGDRMGRMGRLRHDDDGPSVHIVPRGGSAAFLAPQPLSLLAISPEVQHMLEALGVKTLGEFAALPAPSVSRPLEADYQALARGEGGHVLRPYSPDAPIREEIAVGAALSMPAAIAVLAERIARRLAGRGRGAARLELVVSGEGGDRVAPIAPIKDGLPKKSLESLLVPAAGGGTVLTSAETIAEALGSVVQDADRAAWRLRVVVTGEALVGDELASSGASSSSLSLSGAGAESVDEASAPAIVDTLSVVLSNSGSLDLAFAVPGLDLALDRDRQASDRPYRRTRRGKQRRRIAGKQVEALVQPRLFKNLP